MKYLIFIFFALSSQAATLHCSISSSGEVLLWEKAKTKPLEKIKIGQAQGITAYVTEKENFQFTIEAFLPTEYVRIFAEGSLKNSQEKLTASLWSRDSLIEIQCEKP